MSDISKILQWNVNEIHSSSFRKMHLNVSSAKCRSFYLGLNVLNYNVFIHPVEISCTQDTNHRVVECNYSSMANISTAVLTNHRQSSAHKNLRIIDCVARKMVAILQRACSMILYSDRSLLAFSAWMFLQKTDQQILDISQLNITWHCVYHYTNDACTIVAVDAQCM